MFRRWLPALFVGLMTAAQAPAGSLLVAASQVRLRSAPAQDASVLATLPLGAASVVQALESAMQAAARGAQSMPEFAALRDPCR